MKRVQENRGRPPIHGKSKTKIHSAWSNMHRRCYDSTTDSFKTHGGRGIQVCKRWHTFENFLTDMGDVPTGMTLDRTNNGGNYSKSNCRWASVQTQARNRRTNRLLTFQGKTLAVCEWSERLGVSRFTIATRLHRGWTTKEALMGRSV